MCGLSVEFHYHHHDEVRTKLPTNGTVKIPDSQRPSLSVEGQLEQDDGDDDEIEKRDKKGSSQGLLVYVNQILTVSQKKTIKD